jgi:nucleoside-diphosphate-sugar epimerase
MRVFLTGATGYIGAFVARELKRHGHDVVGLARSAAAADALRRAGVHAVPGDLEDQAALRDLVLDAEAVVHCAAAAGPRMADIDAGALDAMLAALDSRHQAFVYTSGVWVYGNRGDAVVGEDAPLAPTPLVAWRPAHEQRVLGFAGHHVRTVVIRPAIVYGEGGGIVAGMIEQARTGTLQIVGDGTNRWSCVRVDALAELYVRALERAARGATYTAARGAAVPYVEIARAAARAAGGDGSVEHLPLEDARAALGLYADALALDLQVSSERAARELGWEPHRPTVLEDLSATTVV